MKKLYSTINMSLRKLTLIAFSVMSFSLIMGSSCEDESTGPDNNENELAFLIGYNGGEEFGSKPGLVKVSANGETKEWISEYYPNQMNIQYMDMKNGRIAMNVTNPPDGVTPIAYMDIDNLKDIKFIPVPPNTAEDMWWNVPQAVRPQVMSDGRIIFKVINETDNEYDDAHDGMLAIYDPETDEFEFSGGLSNFVLAQPEQGTDTEAGSMGSYFALSQDDKNVYLHAYGYGTDAGVYHIDYKFIVRYNFEEKSYNRVLVGDSRIYFACSDNESIVADVDGKKYKVNGNTGDKTHLDDYTDAISIGQFQTLGTKFFKLWRGGGVGLFDQNTGYLYGAVLAEKLKSPYQGLGHGGQFSDDESLIYFTATTDYYTNYKSEYCVFSTPSDLGDTNENPDSLFIMPAEFDNYMFLLLK